MSKPLKRTKTPTDPRTSLFGWAFALGVLSYQVAQGHLGSMDQRVANWMVILHSPSLDRIMPTITFFGSGLWLLLAFVGLGILAWRRGGGPAVLTLLGAWGMGALLEVVLRLSVSQWRPDTLALPDSMDILTRFDLAGFPSGHGFRSALVFGWLARQLPETKPAQLGRVACLIMIGLVGFSRLYLNRHWASDILGAWLVVFVSLSIARVWEQSYGRAAHTAA